MTNVLHNFSTFQIAKVSLFSSFDIKQVFVVNFLMQLVDVMNKELKRMISLVVIKMGNAIVSAM